EHGFSRAFVGPCEQGAYHYRVRSGCKRLGDIARKLDSSVRDQRNSRLARNFGTIENCRNLRDSGTCHHTGRANGARSHPNLHGIHARAGKGRCPFRRYFSSTTGSFSTRCLWSMVFAFSSVVPTGTVIRFSFVIRSEIFRSRRVSKRRSRLVRMPTSFPPEVIGTPEILYFFMTSMASWIF